MTSASRPARLARGLLRELLYVVVLGAPVLLFFLVAAPRANAVRLLRRAAVLRPGLSDFAAVESLAADFHDFSVCNQDGCAFQFQNRWLQRLHLAPMTEFSVLVRRDGPRVASISMAMYIAGRPPAGDPSPAPIASALVFDSLPASPSPNFQATVTLARDSRPLQTVVVLTPGATPQQRNRAHAFNLACLTKITGCKSSRDALPTIWSQARHLVR